MPDDLSILLIEDNPDDMERIQSMLDRAPGVSFRLHHENALSKGLKRLEKTNGGSRDSQDSQGSAGSPASPELPFDAVLLDLGLPDSNGLDTLVTMLKQNRDLPVVVLTGESGEVRGIRGVQMGAQDYLVKDDITTEVLVRSLQYAVLRARLRNERVQMAMAESEDYQAEALERLAKLGLGDAMASKPTLQALAPEKFNELVAEYHLLLTKAEEMRIYKVQHADIAESLQGLAKQLEELKAGPRDVVELHAEALRRATKDVAAKRLRMLREEGCMLALELMGYMVSLYRKYALGKVAVDSDRLP